MASKVDLASKTDAQLVADYVENVQTHDAIEHIGAANRHYDRRIQIVDELKRRSAGTLNPLRGLLEHDDPKIRFCAAMAFLRIDHATFKQTLQALAKRKDKIGEGAKDCLKRFKDPQSEEVAPHTKLPWQMCWQSENPPPKPATRDEIKSLLADALPKTGPRLMRLARPAIGLWPQRPPPDMPIGASRLGGMPFAPPEWQWPMADTEPMLFLGQINCSDVNGLPGSEKLPSSGMLAFFGDHDSVTGCLLTGRGIAVYHWPDIERLVPATPPIEVMLTFPLCALVFRALIDLPDPNSMVAQAILSDEEQISRYGAVRDAVRYHGIPDTLRDGCGFGKLLGWPSLVQDYDLDTLVDAANPSDYWLLLQLDQYANGDEAEFWGPGGSLYFVIRGRDLRNTRFDRCEFDMQFT